ncbi:hypothetical protein JQ608_06960 [Bradyrhizobium liaoningense]|uniref:hypothetical protein n=1 Tax=Bradyrhizobium liaoningense TaxID=43992 RepID=UPI001BA5A825|nr:hypothetical protein [Bradyrhizobium liaoningense]MBR0876942.1 hypothetical protein [Bradyrhizobium liaoningense]
MKLLSTVTVGFLLIGFGSAYAQSDDLNKRIEAGVSLIKLGCGTGSASQKTEVKGNVGGRITLLKPTDASADAGASVNFSKEEAQGLVAALQKELTDGAVKLSERQLDCMKPYIDRIFKELFPDQKSEQRDEKRLALEALHTAIRSAVRREYVPNVGDPSRTYSIVINDGFININNSDSSYFGRLSDLKPDVEYVRMFDHNDKSTHSMVRLHCLMSECITQRRNAREFRKTAALVYLKNEVDPKPLQAAFARVIRLF